MTVRLTKIPQLNSIVIKQDSGDRLFISAPNSIVISKEGFLRLIVEFIKIGFLNVDDLVKFFTEVYLRKEENENQESSNNSD